MNLIEMLFAKKAPEDPEIMRLTESDNDAETALILGILKDNNIPCYAKDKRAGSAARLYTGFSISGSAIYIRRSDKEQAEELLRVIRTPDDETDEDDSTDGETNQ
ncbi:MAG: DUF2007 domain-containing protein [Clostridia bacterium]|nr:DUF2007 domain-containing protein [Clostridia bacterium]